MKRVNILLEEEDVRYLKKKAEREKKRGISAVIREYIASDKSPKKMEKDDPIFDIIGIGKGDGKVTSENYEEFLYGRKAL
ncbi:MAG: ribbon-helix-helix protein, CopG family [Nitrospirae bacterium]|nr:ribbon-helix-helix protein, CopG family [Nitrospirota bacterium]